MIPRAQLIDVLFVIVPHSLLLDIAGPAEAFRLANQHRESRGLPPRFRLTFASPAATLCTSGEVAPGVATAARWLRDRLHDVLLDADTPHRLMTVCSGTLLAARAGLLAGRRCTTHHELVPMPRALAPQGGVIDNRVFGTGRPLAASPGITAGIDVAL